MIKLTEKERKMAKEFRDEVQRTKPDNPFTKTLKEMHPEDEALRVLEHGDPLLYALQAISEIHVGDCATAAWHVLSGLSSGFKDRRLTMHLAITGGSGKGKSSIQDHVGLLFDDIETVTSSSAKSQFYKAQTEKFPDGGIIRFDEAEGSEDALVLERALTDRGLTVPTHDTLTTDRKFKQLRIPQINAVWKNSVNPSPDDQLMNRYILLNVDESEEQDIKVAEKQRNEYCYDIYYEKETERIRITRIMISTVKKEPIKIIIPYGYLIESSDYGNRRSLPKFLTILKSITLFYKLQRPCIGEYYFSTRKDFEIAQVLWESTAYSEKTHTNKAQQQVLDILSDDENGAMERKEIAKKIGKGISTVHNYLKALINIGLVSYKEIFDSTRKKLYWKVKDCHRVSFLINWNKIKVEDLYDKIRSIVINVSNIDQYEFYTRVIGDAVSKELMTLLKKSENQCKEAEEPTKDVSDNI